MKKVVLSILLIIFSTLLTQKLIESKKEVNNHYQISQKNSIKKTSKNIILSPSPNQKKKMEKINLSIFVPYWQITENLNELKKAKVLIKDKNNLDINYIYFGITAHEEGINKNEAGFFNLEKIKSLKEAQHLFSSLVLRLLNDEINSKILEERNLQQKIIEETITVAKENNFSELILDLEINAFPFEHVINQINLFVNHFAQKAKSKDLIFSMTIYGDLFYRKRPYDIKFLSSKVNKMYVMAYDFHKNLGDPGPNFPLFGKEKYGYDLSSVIQDFSKLVAKEKLIFVFGLYGYDWVVNSKNRPIKQASALTLNQIKKRFLNHPNIEIKRDFLSFENKIEYSDSSGFRHIIWFEDEVSVEKKQDFLLKQGVYQFGYWAFGYY